MDSKRIACALGLFVALSACASADVGDRELRATHTSKQKPVVPRRAVPLLTEHPAAQTAPAPSPRIVPPAIVAPAPSTPVPVTACDPGGCWSNGTRYNGGAGGTYLDRSGRMCQGNGGWMQCY